MLLCVENLSRCWICVFCKPACAGVPLAEPELDKRVLLYWEYAHLMLVLSPAAETDWEFIKIDLVCFFCYSAHPDLHQSTSLTPFWSSVDVLSPLSCFLPRLPGQNSRLSRHIP